MSGEISNKLSPVPSPKTPKISIKPPTPKTVLLPKKNLFVLAPKWFYLLPKFRWSSLLRSQSDPVNFSPELILRERALLAFPY